MLRKRTPMAWPAAASNSPKEESNWKPSHEPEVSGVVRLSTMRARIEAGWYRLHLHDFRLDRDLPEIRDA